MEGENIAVATDVVTNAPKNDMWWLLAYLLVVFGIIYLFMVRPQRKRMAEYKKV